MASKLLKHSVQIAKENECEFSLLHSSKPHLQDYYHKLGWSKTASISYGVWRVEIPLHGKADFGDTLIIRGRH